MRLILDENLPAKVKEEIIEFQEIEEFIDIDDEYEGMLDFKIVDMMEDEDVMVTRDRELHRNLLDIGKKCVYYDIEKENLVEIQTKIAYYLKGYDSETVHSTSEKNTHIQADNDSLLKERFEELKKENAELRSRVNLLEGKLESILKKSQSALENYEEG